MKKSEGGYTLVELLITVAITGLVFVIAGSAIYQLSTVSGYGNDELTALHEMQNAAHWFNRDGQEAMTAVGANSLTLTWPDSSVVTYNLSGTVLQRVSGTTTLILAQDVTALSFSVQDSLITMNIATRVAGRLGESVQSSYKVHLRPVS